MEIKETEEEDADCTRKLVDLVLELEVCRPAVGASSPRVLTGFPTLDS